MLAWISPLEWHGCLAAENGLRVFSPEHPGGSKVFATPQGTAVFIWKDENTGEACLHTANDLSVGVGVGVCVCMCVWVWVCACVRVGCMCACVSKNILHTCPSFIHAHVNSLAAAYINSSFYVSHTHTCTHAHMHTNTHAHQYTHMHTHIPIVRV